MLNPSWQLNKRYRKLPVNPKLRANRANQSNEAASNPIMDGQCAKYVSPKDIAVQQVPDFLLLLSR